MQPRHGEALPPARRSAEPCTLSHSPRHTHTDYDPLCTFCIGSGGPSCTIAPPNLSADPPTASSAGTPPLSSSHLSNVPSSPQEGHNTASIGGFVTLPPVILGALRQGVEAAQAAAGRHLSLTHESQALERYAKVGCKIICVRSG